MNTEKQIIIYQGKNGDIELSIDLQQDTIWASQAQMAELFAVNTQAITKHIRNIYAEGELQREATCSKMEQVRQEGNREVRRQIEIYSLDTIIAVGYRISSSVGTAFRIWATTRLREYLVQGYTINQSRLTELGQTIQLLSTRGGELSTDESRGLLDIIDRYTESFILLNQYDRGSLSTDGEEDITYIIQYDEARSEIDELRSRLIDQGEATELFGREKDGSFGGILASITATYDGIALYPTIEEQAAHLLYFTIKDHPFIDGNKRIGAFLFVWFLEQNRHRLRKSGEAKINESGLTTLALLIAQSDPREKELMIRLVGNLVGER